MRLASSTLVTAPLRPDPSSGILVPIVTTVRDRAETRLNVVPSLFVLEPTTDDLGQKSASSSLSSASVEFRHQIVLEPDVQTHVLTLTHKPLLGA
jgi:hypothetical protein